MVDLPDFDDLPSVKDMPQGCAWGVWDKDGKKDIYGTLNVLTPDVLKEAAKEVKLGISASLNWPIGALEQPFGGRKGLVHNVKSWNEQGFHGYDDEVEFNTQCSSQWDSLCHYHHQPSAKNYNGASPSIDDLTQTFGNEDKDQKLPTLNHWHARGGLVARGVLIDYKAWADKNNVSYSPFETHKITVEHIEDIAKDQGVELRVGDVLIIRSGYTEELTAAGTGEKQQELLSSHRACGVVGDTETAKWFWNKHFSAVAGDMIGFEHVPPLVDGKEQGLDGLVLHTWFLSMFGMSIGELWDLKSLSETCQKLGRYSFLLTSAPLNVPGLVGSPPNALAVF